MIVALIINLLYKNHTKIKNLYAISYFFSHTITDEAVLPLGFKQAACNIILRCSWRNYTVVMKYYLALCSIKYKYYDIMKKYTKYQ